MKHEIKHWLTGAVLFTAEIEATEDTPLSIRIGLAVKAAVKAKASLDGASLDGARLDGASLVRASLDGARLDGASLVRASLVRARLDGASLVRARLVRARLDGASLVRARLDGASLVRARLDGASLDGASLVDASLVRASLFGARLDGARLDGASLDGASLVDGGQRADGYRFVGWIKGDELMVRAGCRDFTVSEARAHWSASGYRDRTLGAESLLILDRIEATAKVRGLVKDTEA